MIRAVIAICFAALAARADSLTLRDGTRLEGSWAGFSDGQLSFVVDGVVKTFPKSDVANVKFGTPVVTLGLTVDQVTAILGKPKSTQETGGKTIYVYPDVKVTFSGGKVAAIE